LHTDVNYHLQNSTDVDRGTDVKDNLESSTDILGRDEGMETIAAKNTTYNNQVDDNLKSNIDIDVGRAISILAFVCGVFNNYLDLYYYVNQGVNIDSADSTLNAIH